MLDSEYLGILIHFLLKLRKVLLGKYDYDGKVLNPMYIWY